MQEYIKYVNELGHLMKLKELLDQDTRLPLRVNIEWRNLRKTEFILILRGVEGLICKPRLPGSCKSSIHMIDVMIPESYIEREKRKNKDNRKREDAPRVFFRQPIFHPHVWRDGRVCWGIGSLDAENIFLVDWIFALIEYIAYVPNRINEFDPAGEHGREALVWWQNNKLFINLYLSLLDMNKLRVLVNRSKGIQE